MHVIVNLSSCTFTFVGVFRRWTLSPYTIFFILRLHAAIVFVYPACKADLISRACLIHDRLLILVESKASSGIRCLNAWCHQLPQLVGTLILPSLGLMSCTFCMLLACLLFTLALIIVRPFFGSFTLYDLWLMKTILYALLLSFTFLQLLAYFCSSWSADAHQLLCAS